jgi:hypothetical protein
MIQKLLTLEEFSILTMTQDRIKPDPGRPRSFQPDPVVSGCVNPDPFTSGRVKPDPATSKYVRLVSVSSGANIIKLFCP